MKENFKKTKEDFALNVNALTVYTDETSFEIGKEIILNSDTIKKGLVSVKYGAKGNKVGLPVIKNTVYVTPYTSGAFTASGTTTFAESQVQMYALNIMDEIDPKTLKEYFYDLYMSNSYNNLDNLGKYEDIFVQSKTEAAALAYGKAIWQSAITTPKYATTTGNNTGMDGLLQVAYANSASTLNITRVAFTPTNGVSLVKAIATAITTNIPVLVDECEIYLSPADFSMYLSDVVENYKYNLELIKSNQVDRLLVPGSIGFTVVKCNDLSGVASGTFLATRKDNIWVVTPEAEDMEFKIFYSNDARKFRMESAVKLGVGFVQPELVARSA